MIAKRTTGKDMAGLVRYLFSPGTANEHENPRILGTSEGVDVELGRPLDPGEQRDLADQLDWPYQMHETVIPGGHVWHLALTASPQDRGLSDAEWARIGERVMVEMGVDDPTKAVAHWAIAHHGVNEVGAEHIHVAVNLVRADGTRVSTWQDLPKLSRAARQIEVDYGLTVLSSRWKDTGVPDLKRGEIERSKREGCEPDRHYLERVVRASAEISGSEAEFVRRVAAAGAVVSPRVDEAGAVTGYAVAVDRGEGSDRVWFGGGKLRKDLALPALRRHWTGSAAEGDATGTWMSLGEYRELAVVAVKTVAAGGGTVVDEPTSVDEAGGSSTSGTTNEAARQGGGGEHRIGRRGQVPVRRSAPRRNAPAAPDPLPEERRVPATEWAEAHRQVAGVVAHLSTVSPDDEKAWALAAHETAGVLSAWSRRIEDPPGPLARAAEEVSRSAQRPRSQPLERPAVSPLRNLRGVAMVMAQATIRTDTLGAWVLLAGQMMELSRQIQAAHAARDEAHRASRMASQAYDELAGTRQGWVVAGDVHHVLPESAVVEIIARPRAATAGTKAAAAEEAAEAEQLRRRQAGVGQDPGPNR